jgi:cytidyltransferase-like protein
VKKIIENVGDLKKIIPKNKTFTLVGGCFDLLHVGHVHLLEYASSLEDLLVVAVLSDENIRGYKKSGRPIINEKQRAVMLASMIVVDYVFIACINPNGHETISLLQPDSVVFGGGVVADKIERWSNTIKKYSYRTNINIFPRYTKEEVSASLIIKKIREMTI